MENVVTTIMGQPMKVRKSSRHISLLRMSPAAEKVVRNFAILLFLGNTIAILVCIDLLVFGKLNLTLFAFIFAYTLYVNFRIFRGKQFGLGGV